MSKESREKTIAVQGGNHPDFALHTIGWKAFQDLISHVCEAEFHVPVDIYRESNDGGQDATFLIPKTGKRKSAVGTVQCKHVSSSSAKIKPSDLTPELKKIERLVALSQADTYVFVSNLGLDAPVAATMRAKLSKLGVRNPHIWGKEKLISIIRSSARLRALVPQVYGLGDLSTIIDERAVEQTRAMLGHWLPKLKSYVTTESHDKAVRALEKHGVVLLLGNPSTGKSTIGAILSTIASEDCSHSVLQISSPKEFETHWNVSDRNRFFWIDDAFGSNVMREDYVQDWSSTLARVQTAIEMGNKFLFTSRRHIYKAAVPKLGQRNLSAFSSSEAIVDVGKLTGSEKKQILYNHVNFGSQTTDWKIKAKPFLEAVSNTEEFLPGIAERLGNPIFTKKLAISERSLVRFMAEPQEHLIGTITELDGPMRAALILVYANQGRLVVGEGKSNVEESVEGATGFKSAEIWDVIVALEGSFLRSTHDSDGKKVWEFEHPTISDAITKTLDNKPQMLEALLRGASISKILSDFVCLGMPSIKDAVTVPTELADVLVDRLLSVPDETFPNGSLFRFLADRASVAVFRKVLAGDPSIFERDMWSSSHAWINPKFNVHARAHSLGILPDHCREETATLLEDAALSDFDLSFLENEALLSLMPARKLFALGAKIRMAFESEIEEKIYEIGSTADLDSDAESNFETIIDGFRIFEEVLGFDFDNDDLYQNALAVIESETDNIRANQEQLRLESNRDDPSDWMFAKSNGSASTLFKGSYEPSTSDRSIFDDVDK